MKRRRPNTSNKSRTTPTILLPISNYSVGLKRPLSFALNSFALQNIRHVRQQLTFSIVFFSLSVCVIVYMDMKSAEIDPLVSSRAYLSMEIMVQIDRRIELEGSHDTNSSKPKIIREKKALGERVKLKIFFSIFTTNIYKKIKFFFFFYLEEYCDSWAFNSRRSNLPVADTGMESMKISPPLSCLWAATRLSTNWRISWADVDDPFFLTT